MIVRLTAKQRDATAGVGTPLHEQWLMGLAVKASDLMWDCVMPPIGWRTLSDRIVDGAFTIRGQRRGGMEILGTALRRISRARALLEGHPAFKDVAIPGKHFEHLLAWGDSPYPDTEVQPRLLVPHWYYGGNLMLTRWRSYPAGDTARPLDDPVNHYAFILPVDTPAESPAP